jgi:hypothetical protein
MVVCVECGRLLRYWRDAVVIVADCIDQAEKSPDAFEERYTDALLARQVAETAHTALLVHRKKQYS